MSVTLSPVLSQAPHISPPMMERLSADRYNAASSVSRPAGPDSPSFMSHKTISVPSLTPPSGAVHTNPLKFSTSTDHDPPELEVHRAEDVKPIRVPASISRRITKAICDSATSWSWASPEFPKVIQTSPGLRVVPE